MDNTEHEVINPDDVNIWKNEYLIEVNHAGSYKIYADCLGDALDCLIDKWEETEEENPGYFMSDEEIEEEEFPDEYMMGGNHGRYTTFGWHEIFVKENRNPAY